MKKVGWILGMAALLLGACATGNTEGNIVESLIVTDGVDEHTYSVNDLEKLGALEEEFMGETYLGVSLQDLLMEAGFEIDSIKSVKAVASDGFSVLYDSPLFTREDVLIAYALSGGPLSMDDGTFRMVLPGEEGKLNLRFLVQLVVEIK